MLQFHVKSKIKLSSGQQLGMNTEAVIGEARVDEEEVDEEERLRLFRNNTSVDIYCTFLAYNPVKDNNYVVEGSII